jgi:hypothetical protein
MNAWTVGSNGNYFRDMGGFRYCVAHEIVGYQEDGRSVFKFSANRNGNQLQRELHATADDAKRACEADAQTTTA